MNKRNLYSNNKTTINKNTQIMLKISKNTAILGIMLTFAAFSSPEKEAVAESPKLNNSAYAKLIKNQGPDSIADLVEAVSPSVVNISTKTIAKQSKSSNRAAPNVPQQFRELFPDLFGNRSAPKQPTPRRSLGSGFVYNSSGLVITNNHVIDGADEITVSLTDGTKLDAELVGRDAKTDIAVLRVKPNKPLTALRMGSSDKLRVGDWVMAIGNPFGLGGTVTLGIVSAENRDINSGPYDNFIQTDAAINRGNSGGPLINMNGEVVGINSAIISPTGGSIGIGFSIAQKTADNVISQLIKFGETRRGWLGVRIQPVSDDIAKSYGMPKAKGALIVNIDEKGPASRSGFKVGDIILSFDDIDVSKTRSIQSIVAETEIGKRVIVKVLRLESGGKTTTKNLTVITGRLDESQTQVAAIEKNDKPTVSAEQEILGLTIVDANDKVRKQFNLEGDVTGAIITKIDTSSASGEKGIAPGSLIVTVAGQQVESSSEVVDVIERETRRGADAILFLLELPGGNQRFVALPSESK